MLTVFDFFLKQDLVFHGHNESSDSTNQGNFLKILKFLSDYNEEIKRVTVNKSATNFKLTSSDIQKDIMSTYGIETSNIIIQDLYDALFSILVDKAHDILTKEQMAIVILYVNK